nr:trypsin-like peptidase domain-containing protein [Hyphomonas sp. Mor2]
MSGSNHMSEDYDMEKIIGTDDRSVNHDVRNDMWRPICAIYHNFGDPRQNFIGTGVLVGPRTVFTAAHNVFKLATGSRITSGYVRVGVRGGSAAASARIINFKLPKRYLTSDANGMDQYAHDYAVLHLESSAPAQWAKSHWTLDAMPVLGDKALKARTLTLAGFPAKSHTGKIDLHVGQGKALNWTANPDVFSYKIDTSAGQSGAPVFAHDPSTGKVNVAGVHVAGFAGSHNIANRLTNPVRQKVLSWIRDFEARP